MQFPPWILCFWPGLPQLWLQGKVSALIVAVAFAALIQGALLTSFVWSELLPTEVVVMTWLTLGCVWFVFAAVSYGSLRYLTSPGHRETADALFRQAQTEYLKGNWYQAETLLERLLQHDSGDLEARFTLASLYRHVRRVGEAREQLQQLDKLQVGHAWEPEIRREFEYLSRLESESYRSDRSVDRASEGAVADRNADAA